MAAPTSNVRGTFKSASGSLRTGVSVVFRPTDTPKASGGDLITSLDTSSTTDNNGQVGYSPVIALVAGSYRVIVGGIDAFTIQVPDDGSTYDLTEIATDSGAGSSLSSVGVDPGTLALNLLDSSTIAFSREGDPHEPRLRFAVVGGMEDFASMLNVYPIITALEPSEIIGIGLNPGGNPVNVDQNIGYFFHSFIDSYSGGFGLGSADGNHLWYVLGTDDWSSGTVSEITDYFTLPSNERYYKKSFDNVDLFVVSSNNSEPDGNTYGSTQGQWLQTQLAASTARWKLVVFADSPFASVSGYSASWMDWPFADWGASAVFAAGANLFEHITLTGGIPLYVCGTVRTNFATIGAPVSGSVFRYVTNSAVVALDVNYYSMRLSLCDSLGAVVYEHEVVGASSGGLRPYIIIKSGLLASDSGITLDTGVAQGQAFSGFSLFDKLRTGGIVQFDSLPSDADVRANPYLKNTLWLVGTDPVGLWYWHPSENTPALLCVSAQGNVPYHDPPRTRIATPVLTPTEGERNAVSVSCATPGVQIYYAINDETDFRLLANFPADPRITLLSDSTRGWIAVYAIKAGMVDSQLAFCEYETGNQNT